MIGAKSWIHTTVPIVVSCLFFQQITTGIWGFAFASVYLYSHNILAAMFLHFITNIFSNATQFIAEWKETTAFVILNDYIYFALLGIMFLTAVIFLRKEPKESLPV
ncbi:MAG: hypothetical protein NC124_06700 [Clostridium sp.]|nr:hypothetical protein [Roseburia sp.]MCM1498142.1 hypothetical protein [Clostridium sp.]